VCRVGQNRVYTPYMTVFLVISLPKIPYIYMVLANPMGVLWGYGGGRFGCRCVDPGTEEQFFVMAEMCRCVGV